MKCMLNLLAAGCLVALVGCASTTSTSVAPGAVGACGKDCDMSQCEMKKGEEVAPGAVSTEGKKGCGSSCGMKGKAKSDAETSLGTVGDAKPAGCPGHGSGGACPHAGTSG